MLMNVKMKHIIANVFNDYRYNTEPSLKFCESNVRPFACGLSSDELSYCESDDGISCKLTGFMKISLLSKNCLLKYFLHFLYYK